MSIEFIGASNLGQIGSLKKGGNAQTEKKTGSTQGADQVEFSSVLQDVHKAQAGNNSDRTEKIEALKSQIAEGSYAPDLNKVSANLLQFLMEEK